MIKAEPHGHSPPCQALEKQEDLYEASLVQAYLHFQRLDTILGKFNVKMEKVGTWLRRTTPLFQNNDYGSNLTSARSLCENKELLKQQLELLDEVPATLLEWATGDSIELHRVRPGHLTFPVL